VVVGTLAFLPMLLVTALELPPMAIAAAAVLGGMEQALYWTIWQTALHRRIPSDTLSRISSFDWLGAYAFQPLGYAIAGPLAVLLHDRGVLWLGSGVLTLAVIIMVVAVPEIRQSEAIVVPDGLR